VGLRPVLALVLAAAIVYFGAFALIHLSQPKEGYIHIEHISLSEENPELKKAIAYPEITEAINSGMTYFSMDIPVEDYERISVLLTKGSDVVINGRYHRIRSSAFVELREVENPIQKRTQQIPELNETELRRYRPINLTIHNWQLDNEVERTRGYRENDVYSTSATLEEIKAIKKLIEERGEIFRFRNASFQLLLKAKLGYKLYLDPSKCVSAEKLEKFPLLEKGLKEAEKGFRRLKTTKGYETGEEGKVSVEGGKVRVKIGVNDLDRISAEIGSPATCVKYNGSFYSLTLIKPMS